MQREGSYAAAHQSASEIPFVQQKENSGAGEERHQRPHMDHNSEYRQMSKLLHLSRFTSVLVPSQMSSLLGTTVPTTCHQVA